MVPDASAVNRDRRPLTTQPSVVDPGGVGQASFQVGAVPPISLSQRNEMQSARLMAERDSDDRPSNSANNESRSSKDQFACLAYRWERGPLK